jgi:hypothetical protein
VNRARAVAVVLLAAVGAPAWGFVRETTTPYHPETGQCLWRRDRHVTFQVNATSAATYGAAPCGDSTAAEQLAEQSIPAWNSATRTGDTTPCTDVDFAPGPATTITAVGLDGVNLVVFRSGQCAAVSASDPCWSSPGACATKYDCWEHDISIIGLTTTTFDTATGEILDSDVEINGWGGGSTVSTSNEYLTCVAAVPACTGPGQSSCVWEDVGGAVTHEAGHVLGLDHTCQYPPPYDSCTSPGFGSHTMDPYGTAGSTSKRVLSQDDVAGVCAIYPVGGPTATCSQSAPSASQKASGGCASGTGGGALALLLASLGLVGPRLRRGARRSSRAQGSDAAE